MASVVDGVRLLQVAGHTYRQRTQPIDADSSRGRRQRKQHQQQQQQQLDWEAAEEAELLEAAAAAEEGQHAALHDDGSDDKDSTSAAIQQAADGRWLCEVWADPQLFGYVIGRGGATKQEVEAATGCRITCGSGRGGLERGCRVWVRGCGCGCGGVWCVGILFKRVPCRLGGGTCKPDRCLLLVLLQARPGVTSSSSSSSAGRVPCRSPPPTARPSPSTAPAGPPSPARARGCSCSSTRPTAS